jgi:hypothetical protein
MQLSIYLYCVRFHPTSFGPPIGPSSGVSRAANSYRNLAHAVLLCNRVSADSGLVVRQGHCPQYIIIQYKILEDKKFVICGVYCCGMMYTDDALS